MQILIVVTHLLGTGHLRRALNLAQAFARAGHSVSLATGGVPVPQFMADAALGVHIEQLPPLRSDGVNFRRLLMESGAVVTDSYLEARRRRLVELVQCIQPDAIITELYPFGRRILGEEFLAMLQVAAELAAPPIVLASVRDILSAPSSPKKALETDRVIHNFYDAVLVHSDPDSTPLQISWPVSEPLATKLRYTGYVSQPLIKTGSSDEGGNEIVVSAGGGAVGGRLFDTAIAAASIYNELPWRILVGGANPAAEINRLKAKLATAPAVTVESARKDFRQLLQQAACSVSMCGYNTAVDLLQTGTPGVLVPFDEGGESEQRLRAESLSRKAAYSVVLTENLTPENLIAEIKWVRRCGRFSSDNMHFDGATESVRITTELARKRAGH